MRKNFGTFKRLMVEPVILETKKETENFGFGVWLYGLWHPMIVPEPPTV